MFCQPKFNKLNSVKFVKPLGFIDLCEREYGEEESVREPMPSSPDTLYDAWPTIVTYFAMPMIYYNTHVTKFVTMK